MRDLMVCTTEGSSVRKIIFRIFWPLFFCISGVSFIYTLRNIARTVRRFGFADMPIFLDAAHDFLNGVPLYTNVLSSYTPSAAIYKYPPFMISFLLPLAQYDHQAVLWKMWFFFIFIYLASCCYGLKVFGASLLQREKNFYIAVMLIVILNFSPFFETILGIQLEIIFLFLLVLCMSFIDKKCYLMAGSVIAVAAMLKVYPVFMMLYFVVQYKSRAWIGFFVTLSLAILSQIFLLGYKSSHQYFFAILPTLLREPLLLSDENVNVARIVASSGLTQPENSIAVSRMMAFLLFVIFLYIISVRKKKVLAPSDQPLAFSFVIGLMLLVLTNSWANYQILLMIPFMALFAHGLKTGGQGLMCWTGLAFLLTLFTQNAWANNMTIFPIGWHTTVSIYRGGATLALMLALLWALWKEPRSLERLS